MAEEVKWKKEIKVKAVVQVEVLDLAPWEFVSRHFTTVLCCNCNCATSVLCASFLLRLRAGTVCADTPVF